MQGRARGRKGERKTYHITTSPWNLEDIYWMWQKLHARKSAQGLSARGPILPKSDRNFRQPPSKEGVWEVCLINRKKRQELFRSVSRDHSDQLDDGFFGLSCEVDVQYLVGNLVAKMLTSIWRCMSTEETRIQPYLKKPSPNHQITKCGPGFYDAFGQTSPLHPSIAQQTLKKPFFGSLYNFSVASDVQFQGFILNLIWYTSYEFTYTVSIQNPSQTHKETAFIWAILSAPLGVHENFGLEGPDTKSVKHLEIGGNTTVFGRPSFNSLLFICFWMIHIKIEKCHGCHGLNSYLFISKSSGYKVAIMIHMLWMKFILGLSESKVWIRVRIFPFGVDKTF